MHVIPSLAGRKGDQRDGRSAYVPLIGLVAVLLGNQILTTGFVALSGLFSAAVMSPASRGSLALLTLIPTTIALVANSGMLYAVPYFWSTGRLPPRGARLGAVATATVSSVAALFAVAGVWTLGYHWFSGLDRPLLLAAILASPLSALHLFVSQVLLGVGGHKRFALASVVYSGLTFVLWVLIYVGTGRLGVLDAWLTWLGALGVALVLLVPALISRRLQERGTSTRLETRPNRQPLSDQGFVPVGPASDNVAPRREVFAFAVKTQISTALQQLAFRMDTLLLGAMTTTRSVGLYVIATVLTETTWVPATALAQVQWSHTLQGSRTDALRRLFWSSVALSLGAGLLMLTAAQVLFRTILKDYASSFSLVALLLVGAPAVAILRVITGFFLADGKVGAVTRMATVGFVTGLFAYPVAITAMDTTGAALASGIVYWAQGCAALLLLDRPVRGGLLPHSSGMTRSRRHDADS